jgi:iron complex transport system substrate-binding protein
MMHARTVLWALLAATLVGACGTRETTAGTWDEWQRSDNVYAQRFQLWRRGGDRLVLVFGHGGERDTVGAYWLSDEPSSAPPPVSSTKFAKRLQAVAVGSTTHVPYISALGRVDAIAACAHIDQVRDPGFNERLRQGAVKEIATGDGLDREALLALKPEALFGYPFGQGEAHALEGLGIPTIEVSEYLEEHPLGRAEWLRFFGVLFGEERKADSLFAGIRERYEALRVDSSTKERPTVLFGSVWDGQWWVPPGNSYMARLIEDAGGRYVFADRKGDGNIAIDMETMVTVGPKADFWGMIADIHGSPRTADFTNGDDRLISFNAVRRHGLFIGNTRESDLFGQALIEPDRVLADLRWLFSHEPRIPVSNDLRPYFDLVGPDPPRYYSHDPKDYQ